MKTSPQILAVHARFTPTDIRELGRLAFLPSGEVIWETPEAARFLCSSPMWRGKGLPPALRDVLPSGWGMQMLREAFAAQSRPADHATILEHGLAWEGPGCLVFGDQHPSVLSHAETTNLPGLRTLNRAMLRMQQNHQDISSDSPVEIAAGSGLSRGMRPKWLLGINEQEGHIRHTSDDLPDGWAHWLVKSSDTHDPSAGIVEWTWAQAATSAGLPLPETKLFGDNWFGVRRFDRPAPSVRTHLLSSQAAWDMHFPARPFQCYSDLLNLTRRLTQAETEVEAMFRWIAINLALGNRDDHPGNYGFVSGPDNVWRVSPPYDITPIHGDAWGFLLPHAYEGIRAQIELLARQAKVRTATLRQILEAALSARQSAQDLLQTTTLPERIITDRLRRLPEW